MLFCRQIRRTAFTLILGVGSFFPSALHAQQNVPQAANVRDLRTDTWVAADALGRTIPSAATTRPARKDRFVGIFYFLAHGDSHYYSTDKKLDYGTYGEDPRVLRDNTQIIQQVGGDPVSKPEGWKEGGSYWWAEPAVGYFLADDPWVARKNLQMLADAGVDVLIFDVTNAPQYSNAYTTLLQTAELMRKEGSPTPQFAFITYSSTGPVANELYDHIYGKGLYKDLWFQWQGKPLMFGDPKGSGPNRTPLRPEVQSFFTWRYSWANTDGPNNNGKDEWEWIDAHRPQKFGWHDSPNIPEEVPVAVGGWAHENLGRSYQAAETEGGKEPPVNAASLAADTAQGVFASHQWKQALKIDPQFIFVTGWNEWLAGRQYGPGIGMLGRKTQPGQYYFVDEYNAEFSRDIMPMKGGFRDNYYMQMADYIRQFKGARPLPTAHGFKTVTVNSPFAQWTAVQTQYLDAVGDTANRDWPGWGGKHYTDTTGRNDITSTKVACDAKNIAFYVHTQNKITPWKDPNWMQLLIDADHNTETGWNGYEFAVNTHVTSADTTTLKRLSDGKTWPLHYKAGGNEMQILIPRALLGLTHASQTAFDFHWLDNVAVGTGDPADWWYTGDSAPDGRFNYRYQNTKK